MLEGGGRGSVLASRVTVGRKSRSVPEMPVTASVIVFLVSALFAIPGAIAAALFVREREVPTFGRVLAGVLMVILVALPFALAVGAGQLVAWIMSLVG